MTYQPSRDESEYTIALLADRYPNCFFAEPQSRRPLKKNIIADLEKDGVPVTRELLTATVDWYQTHFGYLYALQPGAKRLDLSGKEGAAVTEAEHYAAQAKITEGKRKNAEKTRNNSPVDTLQKLHKRGRIPTDILRKLDAPMKAKNENALARVYAALDAAGQMMTGEQDALRSAMAVAALGVVIKETQNVIDHLAGEED
jgi:sRNA-binding protein